MQRILGLVVACAGVMVPLAPARAQFGFALDPAGASPGVRAGGFGYSGYGYSAVGPRGRGYYVGLPNHTASNGPSGYFSPVFSAMAAAPRESVPLGPTYGGYAGSRMLERHAHAHRVTAGIAHGFLYGSPSYPGAYGYSSSYSPPGHMPARRYPPAPGFTYGYGQPPDPPRGVLGLFFDR